MWPLRAQHGTVELLSLEQGWRTGALAPPLPHLISPSNSTKPLRHRSHNPSHRGAKEVEQISTQTLESASPALTSYSHQLTNHKFSDFLRLTSSCFSLFLCLYVHICWLRVLHTIFTKSQTARWGFQ